MREGSKQAMLSRIGESDYRAAVRHYAQLAVAPPPDDVPTDRFAERVQEYGAKVETLERATVAEWVADYLRQRRLDRLVVGRESAWASETWALPDADLPSTVLDSMGAALVDAAAAIADTGTVILDGRTDGARRALSLIPDRLICLVRESTIHASLEEWWALSTADRPITLISGPSATSDIELKRVVGVHGPRRLHVIVVRNL